MTTRRALLGTLAGGLLAAPLAVVAQGKGPPLRVGIFTGDPRPSSRNDAFRQGLRDLGYMDGSNVIIEWRDAEGKVERLDDLAAELVRLKVNVIVASNPGSVFAAKRATTSIPIVMVNTPDPVQLGLVASLGRPGGNITGTTTLSVDLSIKQLELLKEAVPRVSRIAVLWNPSNPWHPIAVNGIKAGARSAGVQLQILEVKRPADFENSFVAMARERSGAVLVLADPMIFFHRVRLAALAANYRLPTMHGLREHVEAGGLMSYWADSRDLWRGAGIYVGKILNGAKPGDLPIEQPTKFELVINLKTAKALGITIPQSLLLRADDVIQ